MRRSKGRRGSVSVTVDGMDDVLSALTDLGKSFGTEKLARAAMAAGEVVRQRASELAPRSEGPGNHPDGGHAADHLVVEANPGIGEGKARVGPDKGGWYLGLAETGTSKQAAKPWLRPALDQTKEVAVQAMKDELKRE